MGASSPAFAKAMRAFRADDSGATAAEYGMITCGVALVVVVLVGSGLSPAELYQKAAVIAEVLAGDDEAIAVQPAVAGGSPTTSVPGAQQRGPEGRR